MPFGRAGALAAATLLWGCGFPTEPPILDQQWVVPVDRTTIPVADLLPAGVAIDGSAFAVSVAPTVTARSLGSLCGPCVALQGVTAPIPPFSGSFSSSTPLPADVTSGMLTSGAVQIAVRNGFSFDPLANGGQVVITLRDGAAGRQLGRLELQGPTDALPPGATLTRTIDLAPGAVGSSISSLTEVTVHAGSVARIDNGQEIRVTATPTSILASSARVDVSGRAVTFETVELDVADLEDFEDDVTEGAVVLDVSNPFGVGVTGQLRVTYPGGVITKPITIGAGASSTVSIPFTGDELRAFIGTSPVTLAGSGSVAAGAGAVDVSPQEVVDIEAKFRLTVEIGG